MREGSYPVRDHQSALPSVEAPVVAGAADPAALAARAREHLLSLQAPEGLWCAELEGDTILASETVLVLRFLEQGRDPLVGRLAEALRRAQLPGGGWAIYPGGPPEVSASVKAWFALRLAGDPAEAPHMERARRVIHELGGLDACNSYTRICLAIFGQVPWSASPAIPPELVLLPRWFPIHLHAMSAWSRAIVVPLSVVWALKPRAEVAFDLEALRSDRDVGPTDVTKYTGRRTVWTRLFALADRALKRVEALGLRPLRPLALRRAERWVLDRLEGSDGLGAIFPPIVNTLYAFKALGYADDDPRLLSQVAELRALVLEDEERGTRVQPCRSPVWDTALALDALLAAGVQGDDPRVLAAARWLIDREVRTRGDWSVRMPHVPPGGWAFEYRNEPYPDADDTAEVLSALARVRFPDAAEDAGRRGAIRRGQRWLLAMQNRDGGWPAFDRDCTREILQHVPFADHNAMLDPSCEDITGRALKALAVLGMGPSDPAVRRAVRFLLRRQEPDGAWFGRWGCHYVYGTWLALSGLAAAGLRPDAPAMRRGAAFLLAHQNPDGGWGESPQAYDEPARRGEGPSTASQTAWALLGLHAAGHRQGLAVTKGLAWLAQSQRPDGSWHDEAWTGTGFPRVFYLRYHLYATYFPLRALAALARGGNGNGHPAGLAGRAGRAAGDGR